MEIEEIRDCMLWLHRFFHDNGRIQPRRVVRAEALKAGFSQHVLKQARKRLGVQLLQNFMPNPQGTAFEDYWRLP
jgi:hypothetical protein